MNLLAADIGGTKTLLGVFSFQSNLIKLHQQKYISGNWQSFDSILKNFFETLPNHIQRPQIGCCAIAGPVSNGLCNLTNLDWHLDQKKIRNSLCLDHLELINDVSVILYGIPSLKKNQYVQVQCRKNENNNDGLNAVIAAGTGLGISRGYFKNDEIIYFASEGGHREFSPRFKAEWELSGWIKSNLNLERISLERIVSGNGLGLIACWRLNQADAHSHPLRNIANGWLNNQINEDLPSLVSNFAKKGDQLMKEVLDMWLSAYGSVAGDLALQELCQGGLWIAGGTAAKQIDGICSEVFLQAMRNKGRFSQYLHDLPVMALIDPEVGLFSAACRARIIAESSEKLN